MGANDLILNLRENGFTISAEKSRLLIAPAGKLTDELKKVIKQRKYEILTELQRETRQQKVLAILEKNPDMHRATYADTNSDPHNVILTIAIRNVSMFEMVIAKSKYNPWEMMVKTEDMGVIH